MGLNCGAKCVKYTLFAFNIIFFLGGGAVLGVGIWLRVAPDTFTDFLSQVDPSGQATDITGTVLGTNVGYIHTVAYVLIAIGAFVFIVGFMGCCGACQEWRPLLIGYAVCLIIIVCAEIGIGIAVGVYKDDTIGALKKEMMDNVIRSKYSFVETRLDGSDVKIVPKPSNQNNNENVINTNIMNSLHVVLGCCGLDNYTDLTHDTPYAIVNSGPPVFCCQFTKPEALTLKDTSCYTGTNNPFISNANRGCFKRIEELIETYAPAIIGVTVAIGLIELVGIFFAFCLCCAIGDKRKGR